MWWAKGRMWGPKKRMAPLRGHPIAAAKTTADVGAQKKNASLVDLAEHRWRRSAEGRALEKIGIYFLVPLLLLELRSLGPWTVKKGLILAKVLRPIPLTRKRCRVSLKGYLAR